LLPGYALAQPTSRPADAYLLHLPGIAGFRSIDEDLLQGLSEGGVTGTLAFYDWTIGDAGLAALYATSRNQDEAQRIANLLEKRFRTHPGALINVTAHSGGAGIAVWALEKLPDDVQINSLTLLAPALSPGYDLSAALRHVSGDAYVFYSELDPVLGPGTYFFRTIDGVNAEAAGKTGFDMPPAADLDQYCKLVQIPYDPHWWHLGHIGDHISMMAPKFSRTMIAPLILHGEFRHRPATAKPTTRPIK
jgi:pimeloyl-ACP methyl ester carboxylesterase